MTNTINRTCSHCGQSKPLTDFVHDKSRKHGRAYECYDCRKNLSNMRSARKRGLKISARDMKIMVELARTSTCHICGGQDYRALNIDHSHATGQVRGLLCNQCNMGIGCLKENPELMRRAIAYLEFHRNINNESKSQ